MSKKIVNRVYFALILSIGVIFCFMNFLTPLIADDFGLMGSKNIADIIARNYSRYFSTNGRVPAHILAMTFLMFDKSIFNIANTAVYLLFTFLILFHATNHINLTKWQKLICWLLINLLLFIYTPSWGQVFLWLDGACNYLWTGTIMLLYLVPFRENLFESKKYNKWIFPGMFLMGILAGWCNENTSGGTILITILLLAYFMVKRMPVYTWMYSGMAGTLVGFSFMILAPGNSVRLTYFDESKALYNRLAERFQYWTNAFYNNYRYILFVLAIVTTVLVCLHIEKKHIQVIMAYFLTSVAVCYALILTPTHGERPLFGCMTFLMISLTYAVAVLLCNSTDKNWGGSIYGYISVLMVIATVNLFNGIYDMAYYKVHVERRNQYVLQLRDRGISNVIVNEVYPKPMTKYNAAKGLSDLVNNPNTWPNPYYARAYGIETVSSVPYAVFQKVFKDGNEGLINCCNIYDYLEMLDNPKYMVIMAVSDDSSGAIDEKIVNLMKGLGLKTDLRNNFRWSYIAVINQGHVIHESYANRLLNFYETVGGHSVEVESSGKIYNKGNHASIKIDGYEYARNSLGLNLVVFDTDLDRVVDRVTFETWKGLGASR